MFSTQKWVLLLRLKHKVTFMFQEMESMQGLTTMFEAEFNSDDQQIFLMHFRMYLAHGDDNSKHVVDLDVVYKWLGFTRKDNAKRMLTKNFDKDTDYSLASSLLPKEEQSSTKRGGVNKETILMSVPTFKGMCMLSNTERGKQTRRYYLQMEYLFFKYTQEKLFKQSIDIQHMQGTIEANEIVTQQKLVEAYHQKPCVYVIRVSPIDKDESYVVKIGETDDIKTRLRTHRSDFSTCVLLEVVACIEAHKLEQYVLKRPDVLARRIPGTETIHLDKEFTLKTLSNIIKSNVVNFEDNAMTADQKLRFVYLKNVEYIFNSNFEDEVKKDMINKLYLVSNLEYMPTKTEPESDRRIYKYQADNLSTIVGVYNSLREAARSLSNRNIHDYHIRDACNQNTVVDGYRWILIERSDDNPSMAPPDTIPDTFEPPKIERKHQKKLGMVAQICPTTNMIINVFACVKDAADSIKLSACSISLSLHKSTKAGTFIWKLWDECVEELKEAYQGAMPKPLTSRTCSKPIAQIDPVTRQVVMVHENQQAVANQFRICHKKLSQLCKSGNIYKNFIWALA
jgi:phage anti-repressor protein